MKNFLIAILLMSILLNGCSITTNNHDKIPEIKESVNKENPFPKNVTVFGDILPEDIKAISFTIGNMIGEYKIVITDHNFLMKIISEISAKPISQDYYFNWGSGDTYLMSIIDKNDIIYEYTELFNEITAESGEYVAKYGSDSDGEEYRTVIEEILGEFFSKYFLNIPEIMIHTRSYLKRLLQRIL